MDFLPQKSMHQIPLSIHFIINPTQRELRRCSHPRFFQSPPELYEWQDFFTVCQSIYCWTGKKNQIRLSSQETMIHKVMEIFFKKKNPTKMRSNENGEVNGSLHTKGMSSPGTLPPSRQAALFLTLPTPGTQGEHYREETWDSRDRRTRKRSVNKQRQSLPQDLKKRQDTGVGGTHL